MHIVKYHTALVKRYTTQLARRVNLPLRRADPLLQILPFLFFVAVFITNTIAWLNGANWYHSVLNTWLLLGWLIGTGLIYVNRWK